VAACALAKGGPVCVLALRWRRAVRRSYGFDADAMVTRSTLAYHYLRGAPFASWAERARSFAAADMLEPRDHKAYLRTLLYPARFCYSWMTGLMGSNDVAVAFLKESHPAGLDVSSLECALQCRQSAADPDALFPARKVLPSQIDACVALISA
jgi:hypothetical protein